MIWKHTVIWEDSGYTVLARILGHDGLAIAQADVSTIAWTIAADSDRSTAVATGTLVVADVVYDALQTDDARWTLDTTGFNFATTMAATTVPVGGETYQLRYTFSADGSEVYQMPVLLKTRDLWGT